MSTSQPGLKFPLRRVAINPVVANPDSDDDEELEKRDENENVIQTSAARSNETKTRHPIPEPLILPAAAAPPAISPAASPSASSRSRNSKGSHRNLSGANAADSKVTPDALMRIGENESPILSANADTPRPFAGTGRRLAEVIRECWRTWTDMMITDAKNNFTDAMVEYGLALWRGDLNANIAQNRKEGRRWMARAVSRGKHDLYSQGNCGRSNCHKCAAIYYLSKMDLWINDETVKTKTASRFQVLHTPSLMLRIAKFLDVKDLIALHQCSRKWRNFVEDPRTWEHLEIPLESSEIEALNLPMLLLDQPISELRVRYPAAIPKALPPLDPIPPSEAENPLQCRGCQKRLSQDEPRFDAIQFPNIFSYVIVVCEKCFYRKASMEAELRPTSAADALILSYQWDMKLEARASYHWERSAVRRKRVKLVRPALSALVNRNESNSVNVPLSSLSEVMQNLPDSQEQPESAEPAQERPHGRSAPHLQNIYTDPKEIDRQLNTTHAQTDLAEGKFDDVNDHDEKVGKPFVEPEEVEETEGGEGSEEQPTLAENGLQNNVEEEFDMDAFFMGGSFDVVSAAVEEQNNPSQAKSSPVSPLEEVKASVDSAYEELRKKHKFVRNKAKTASYGKVVPNLISPLGWPRLPPGSDPYLHLDMENLESTLGPRDPLELSEPIDELPESYEGEPDEEDPFAKDPRAKIMLWTLDEFAFVPRNIEGADDDRTTPSKDNPLSSMSSIPFFSIVAYDKLQRARGLSYMKLRHKLDRFWLALSNLPEAEILYAQAAKAAKAAKVKANK